MNWKCGKMNFLKRAFIRTWKWTNEAKGNTPLLYGRVALLKALWESPIILLAILLNHFLYIAIVYVVLFGIACLGYGINWIKR